MAPMYVQQPCGHLDLVQPIVRLMPGVSIASVRLQCWYCRREVMSIAPVRSEAEAIRLTANSSKLEKLALAHRIASIAARADSIVN